MGGSPCTFWSVAKARRELDKGGTGWKLFMRFMDAVRQIKPRFFLYENVTAMPKNIRAYISEEFGCEPIQINSALVSAQHRKRLYWTNIQGITQPEGKGILVRDILESGLTAREKSHSVFDTPVQVGAFATGGLGNRIYSVHGKTVSLMAHGGGGGAKTGMYKLALPDGNYLIRKLTPTEAERCQTLPDDYTALGMFDDGTTVNISNAQRYRAIGNGWTVDVIAHILSHMAIGG